MVEFSLVRRLGTVPLCQRRQVVRDDWLRYCAATARYSRVIARWREAAQQSNTASGGPMSAEAALVGGTQLPLRRSVSGWVAIMSTSEARPRLVGAPARPPSPAPRAAALPSWSRRQSSRARWSSSCWSPAHRSAGPARSGAGVAPHPGWAAVSAGGAMEAAGPFALGAICGALTLLPRLGIALGPLLATAGSSVPI